MEPHTRIENLGRTRRKLYHDGVGKTPGRNNWTSIETMSNKTENFLRMCIEELGVANKTLLEDIAYTYEKWQASPHFPRYEGEGIKTAWLGPVEPGGVASAKRWETLGPVLLHGFIEDGEGRFFSFTFNDRRPFEEVDFKVILKHLSREIDLAEKDVPNYFQKMYRMNISSADYPLDWNKAPFDWDEAALWNLRWIIKGLDMESPHKKRIFQLIRDELQAEWSTLQQATQAHWNDKILKVLKLDDSATYNDYRHFSQFIVKTSPAAVQGFMRYPWAIGVVNGKSEVSERARFQLAKALQQGSDLEHALMETLELPADTLKALAGKKSGELGEGVLVKAPQES